MRKVVLNNSGDMDGQTRLGLLKPSKPGVPFVAGIPGIQSVPSVGYCCRFVQAGEQQPVPVVPKWFSGALA